MGKIADAVKYDDEFAQIWNGMSETKKRQWLLHEHFKIIREDVQGEEINYATVSFNELRKHHRQRFRARYNDFVKPETKQVTNAKSRMSEKMEGIKLLDMIRESEQIWSYK